jgi:hypothetical protein
MADLIEERLERSNGQGGAVSNPSSSLAQTFTTQRAYGCIKVALKMYREGTPPNITVALQGVDGSGFPDGSDLESISVDITGITTSLTGEWVECVFASTESLSADTKYAIVVRDGFTDASNRYRWRQYPSYSYYAGGTKLFATTGSNWVPAVTQDFTFRTYSDDHDHTEQESFEGAAPYSTYNLDSSNDWRGNTFTTGSAFDLTRVDIYIGKSLNDDVGVLDIEIYAVDGDHKPTGDALGSATLDDAGVFSEYFWCHALFGTPVSLSAATEYAMIVHGTSLSAAESIITHHDGAGTLVGYLLNSTDGGSSWTTDGVFNFLFKVYSDAASYVDITGTCSASASVVGGTLEVLENVELTGTISAVASVDGTLSLLSLIDITGTVTATSSLTATLTVAANWNVTTMANIKRIVAAGNDKIYYEDI